MALITCEECGKEISDKANTCPHCGAPTASTAHLLPKNHYSSDQPTPNPPKGSSANRIFTATAIGFLILLPFVLMDKPTSANTTPDGPTKTGAYGACLEFVKRNLHDPYSAKFNSSDTSVVMELEDGWNVIIPTRAKNAFGAYVKSDFICKLQYDNGNWYQTSIKETH